jgi:drug/metabolite transporter (DMT)-like permease
MAIGTVCFVPFAWPELHSLAWTGVSAGGWAAIGFSGTFALFISYVIWFTGIQRFGNTRTSIYSNMVPVVGMTVGWFWLGEAIGPLALVGAGAILAGVVLTKV